MYNHKTIAMDVIATIIDGRIANIALIRTSTSVVSGREA
jgi:hypothetical protein